SKNGLAEIEVRDYGSGIDKEIIDKVWHPFFTTKSEGTGLGLAICKQIVDDHRGQIEIESKLGEGTTVRITFPPLADSEDGDF
ncbi:MAG: histidine kinase, partial [Blastocatellia bacterium]|nr:histidine kinase [Blastocatellia bacterium]